MKLSIIVPVYNAEKYIKRCILSIIDTKASKKDYEVIIIDDGSRDSSATIIDELSHNNQQIKVIHQDNLGVSAARNAGLLLSSGEYVTFVDADDWVQVEYIGNLLEIVNSVAADLYLLSYKLVDWNNKIQEWNNPIPEGFYSGDLGKIYPHFAHYEQNMVWNKIFRNKLIKDYDIKFHVGKALGEDFEFIQDYVCYIQNILVKKYHGYYYCSTPNSALTLQSCKVSYIMDDANTLEHTLEYIRKKGIDDEYYIQFCDFMRHLTVINIARLYRKGISKNEIQEAMNKSRMREMLLKSHGSSIRGKLEIFFICKNCYYIIAFIWEPIIQKLQKIRTQFKRKE